MRVQAFLCTTIRPTDELAELRGALLAEPEWRVCEGLARRRPVAKAGPASQNAPKGERGGDATTDPAFLPSRLAEKLL